MIDINTLLQFIFRVGLMLLAFFLGTRYHLVSKNFTNFSMYAIFRTCKEHYPRCEKCCPYYSEQKEGCLLQSKLPKDWKFSSPVGRIERKDA